MKPFAHILMLFVFILSGCASPAKEYLASHPHEDPEIIQLIKEKKLRKGMTREQVRAAWGNPCVFCAGQKKLRYLGILHETWVYDNAGPFRNDADTFEDYFDSRRYVYFENGRVVDWTE